MSRAERVFVKAKRTPTRQSAPSAAAAAALAADHDAEAALESIVAAGVAANAEPKPFVAVDSSSSGAAAAAVLSTGHGHASRSIPVFDPVPYPYTNAELHACLNEVFMTPVAGSSDNSGTGRLPVVPLISLIMSYTRGLDRFELSIQPFATYYFPVAEEVPERAWTGGYDSLIRDVWPVTKSLIAQSQTYGITFLADSLHGGFCWFRTDELARMQSEAAPNGSVFGASFDAKTVDRTFWRERAHHIPFAGQFWCLSLNCDETILAVCGMRDIRFFEVATLLAAPPELYRAAEAARGDGGAALLSSLQIGSVAFKEPELLLDMEWSHVTPGLFTVCCMLSLHSYRIGCVTPSVRAVATGVHAPPPEGTGTGTGVSPPTGQWELQQVATVDKGGSEDEQFNSISYCRTSDWLVAGRFRRTDFGIYNENLRVVEAVPRHPKYPDAGSNFAAVMSLNWIEPYCILVSYVCGTAAADGSSNTVSSYPLVSWSRATRRFTSFPGALLDETDGSIRLHRYTMKYIPEWRVAILLSNKSLEIRCMCEASGQRGASADGRTDEDANENEVSCDEWVTFEHDDFRIFLDSVSWTEYFHIGVVLDTTNQCRLRPHVPGDRPYALADDDDDAADAKKPLPAATIPPAPVLSILTPNGRLLSYSILRKNTIAAPTTSASATATAPYVPAPFMRAATRAVPDLPLPARRCKSATAPALAAEEGSAAAAAEAAAAVALPHACPLCAAAFATAQEVVEHANTCGN